MSNAGRMRFREAPEDIEDWSDPASLSALYPCDPDPADPLADALDACGCQLLTAAAAVLQAAADVREATIRRQVAGLDRLESAWSAAVDQASPDRSHTATEAAVLAAVDRLNKLAA